jgi:hypothetical protein
MRITRRLSVTTADTKGITSDEPGETTPERRGRGRADELAQRLADRLYRLRDARMRRIALAATLSGEPAADVVAMLTALLAAARRRPSAAVSEAIETLAAALSEPELLSYPVRVELYEAAKLGGREEIARMLFDVSPGPAGADDAGDEAARAERPLVPRGRPLTLGERKALARGHRRDVLEKLVRDPHPDVVSILLGNPHLTERDVLRIATRRPAPVSTLTAVAASERWITRYSVKRALVLNPSTPPHITVRLAATLGSADLQLVAADANLPEVLRSQAALLLARD